MGFNTTVLILNDALPAIERDAEFGRKLANAIGSRYLAGARPEALRVTSGGSDAARVIETHHADMTAVVLVGGNDATVLGHVPIPDHHVPTARLAILKLLAAEAGYRLTRFPQGPRTRKAAQSKGSPGTKKVKPKGG